MALRLNLDYMKFTHISVVAYHVWYENLLGKGANLLLSVYIYCSILLLLNISALKLIFNILHLESVLTIF
jgi:hypothetical protein